MQQAKRTQLYSSSLWSRIWKNRMVYMLILPGLVWYIIFAYMPIAGLQLAFKTYKAKLGIWGSPWCGLENFKMLTFDNAFLPSIWRTLSINLGKLIFVFPVPIILAIMLDELRLRGYKKSLQTIFTFPHFLSWVVIASMMKNILSADGFVNSIIMALGGNSINFLGNSNGLKALLYISEDWKTTGWSAIIYMASISSIDVDQYEAAYIDGTTRLQRIWYITLPNLKSTIMILFILQMGSIMSGGFDQIFNLDNAALGKATETLDMYIYNITFRQASNFGFSTAVSLLRSIVNMVLLVGTDRISKRLGGSGLMG